jgi:ATP-dependent helicase/nuclease subunit A
VATTRPRDRLYVCGWVDKAPAADSGTAEAAKKTSGEESWHALLDAALRGQPGVREIDLPWGGARGLRLGAVDDPGIGTAAAMPAEAAADGAADPGLPGWARDRAPSEAPPQPPLNPSALGAPSGRAGAGPGDPAAAQRGVALHRLFEVLPGFPAADREAAARRLLAWEMPDLPEAARAELAAEALGVLIACPELFGPGSRAEVPVIGTVAGHAVSGQIDRLVVGPDAVLIADFKSNRVPPRGLAQVPDAYAAQLALYRALLAPLYPGRALRCVLVWTVGATTTEVPPDRLDAALASLTALGSGPRPTVVSPGVAAP